MNAGIARTPGVARGWWPEIIVSLVCAGVILVCALWLYRDFFSKGAGTGRVVGHMSFHQGDNARRPAGRVTWGRLDTGDPLYRNDTVRTAEASEALLDLKDGTGVEMDPKTMIVLTVSEDLREIEVRSGSVLIRTPDESGAEKRWRIQNRKSPLPADRVIRFTREADGTIREQFIPPGVTDAAKEGRDFAAGEVPLPLAPQENQRFFVDSADAASGSKKNIDFRWRGAGEKQSVLLLARDPGFTRMVAEVPTDGASAGLALAMGRYYWRVRTADGRAGPVSRFSVIQRESPRLIAPAGGARVFAGDDVAPIVFDWRGPRGVSYRLEVARDASFGESVLEQQVHRAGITLAFAPGTYYWRLTALGSLPGGHARSEARSFVVAAKPSQGKAKSQADEQRGSDARETEAERVAGKGGTELEREPQAKKIPRPVPIFPGFLMAVDMADQESIPFRWSPVPGATGYIFRLYNAGNIKQPVYYQRTTGPYLNFARLEVLDEGEFVWTVDANVPGAPENANLRGFSRFHILLSERPQQPELELE